ncbi:MAG: phosphoenolpyruvate carboxykinase (ATP) [Bdellovibrionales bacterium]|nr:phosphoenolpyruvate carboxykinase (ATP) [Bdellovibrionales bacterium]
MTRLSLIEESIRNGVAKLSQAGALIVETGRFTGRAADRRYIADRPEIASTVNWGAGNKKIDLDFKTQLLNGVQAKLENGTSYQYKGWVGGFAVEVNSTSPWHTLFATNMFREQPIDSLKELCAKYGSIRIFHDPYGTVADHGLKFDSDTVIILDPVELTVVIVGTAYAGEIKKSAFSLCNYLFPEMGIFPMHASANCTTGGQNSSVLFGLSGTGKTTLSASNDRLLIGDDEIIWSKTGLSNLEGGCYAKLINLSEKAEPEIFNAANSFGTILENVVVDEKSRQVDFTKDDKTENTRGSYDITILENCYNQNIEAAKPNTVVFLTADAFGALPAVAKLDSWQAQYHFISGYTAKVAGTELGVTEPEATFSSCFGAPFMPRHPSEYAKLLADCIAENNSSVWLLNTGWTNGGYGKGPRFPIRISRELLKAIQDGTLDKQEMIKHPVFGFMVPTTCPGIDESYLKIPTGPAVTALATKFIENMARVGQGSVSNEVILKGGPAISDSENSTSATL